MPYALREEHLRLPEKKKSCSTASSLSKLCDLQDWESEEFQDIARSILYSPDEAEKCKARGEPAPVHRKLWEFAKTVQALERYGLLHGESRGLSVAAGSERILFYLANCIEQIVATDIYGIGDFASGEADDSFLDSPEKFAPYPYQGEKLHPLFMDALNLRFSENLFDFAFSLSSLEHFGGYTNALRSIQEMARVVRPGGLVLVATDCALNGVKMDEVFSWREIESLVEESGLLLDESIDWSLSRETLEHCTDMRSGDLSTLPHLNLKLFGSCFTSVFLALRKGGEPFPQKATELFTEEISRVRRESMDDQRLFHEQFLVEQGAKDSIHRLLNRVKNKILFRLQEWWYCPTR
ncbi:methyltransferase domain-containing protein [bacterium]|nr:methyltransferase domain-containing protein [bacterium]